MDIKEVKKDITLLSLVFGLLFLFSGGIEVVVWICSVVGVESELPLFVGDVFGGLALLAVGITYLLGVKKAVNEDIRAISYLFTASIVGLGIGIIALLLLIANAIGFLLGFDDWADWSIFNDLNIYLICGLLAVIPYKIARIISSK
ncbi:hypothetical protein [Methanocaldococcus fervens]|uniref:Uncharacterized protein n=1 Tax=Methanocaldococcus fervens (strain DSM 4213 / JCM 15782 / AG86) TaxID=573064 RepID=C7P7Q2_METFA|nr:hypothetical protein [Methanocaldococcus fervens]ACV24584.1 hypothetical protein Mefer_0766 [Methanocaldococcus fervens AG86]